MPWKCVYTYSRAELIACLPHFRYHIWKHHLDDTIWITPAMVNVHWDCMLGLRVLHWCDTEILSDFALSGCVLWHLSLWCYAAISLVERRVSLLMLSSFSSGKGYPPPTMFPWPQWRHGGDKSRLQHVSIREAGVSLGYRGCSGCLAGGKGQQGMWTLSSMLQLVAKS